jgi:hypothetical protein
VTGTGACVSLLKLNLEYLLLLMFVALTGYCKSRVIRLDFGHFRAGIHVGHVFARFQSVCSRNGTKAHVPLSEKSPDSTRLVELAKVQIMETRHKSHPVSDWTHQQVYLHPYPKELMLRNHG